MNRIFIALGIVGITIISLIGMKLLSPKPKKVMAEKVLPLVESLSVHKENFPIKILSQGNLVAEKEVTVSSEVTGQVLSAAESFNPGGEFKKGDVLLSVDDADYRVALESAKASEAQAYLSLTQEKARSAQAERDWKKIGGGKKASDLVLRKPQLEFAKASYESAKAMTQQAQRNFEKTKWKAPFDGKVKNTFVDVGSYVGTGARLMDVYSNESYEVRLPVSISDFALLEGKGSGLPVELTTIQGGETIKAEGKLIRNEGVIDSESRSVFLVVSYDGSNEKLVPGIFLNAEIKVGEFENVYLVPQKALYGSDKLFVIDANNQLVLREVSVLKVVGDSVVISSGLAEGERVSVTSVPSPINGMKVNVSN